MVDTCEEDFSGVVARLLTRSCMLGGRFDTAQNIGSVLLVD